MLFPLFVWLVLNWEALGLDNIIVYLQYSSPTQISSYALIEPTQQKTQLPVQAPVQQKISIHWDATDLTNCGSGGCYSILNNFFLSSLSL